ncbi:hypothetical protein [Catenulispora rubra]|uniref:hypothetical protein n=1 Tax=Catenulispora rubra TaxID=280293 RepID=UPI0018924654|nr:hypothetical protein [Catenulispora rubra]
MSTDTPRTAHPQAPDVPPASNVLKKTREAFPRLRDPEQYDAASAAGEGDQVEEIDAGLVRDDMTVWFPDPVPGRWRPVRRAFVAGPKAVIEFAVPPPYSASWSLASDRPVCRRITSRETSLSSPVAESSRL